MPPDRVQLDLEYLRAALVEDWPTVQVDAALALLARGSSRFPAAARELPAELIVAVQRQRLIGAMLSSAAELGYLRTSVRDVIERAGISRPVFYDHFENKEDCFLTAFDTTAARLRRRLVAAAAGGGDSWREQLRLALAELLHFASAEPDAARVLVVEARGASAKAVRRRDDLLGQFTVCLDRLAAELLAEPPPASARAAAGVVGGVEALLYARLNRGAPGELETILPALLFFAVLPYEGRQAASEALAAAG